MLKKILARLELDRRRAERRDKAAEKILSSLLVFTGDERKALRSMERRKNLRRKEDVRRRVAAL
jgi:hypothetical protein